MRMVKFLLSAVVIASILSSLSYAVGPDRISGALVNSRTSVLHGNVHRKAQPRLDLGPVDPAMRLGSMTLLTVPTAAQQKALTKLLAEQQDRASSNYHKWLTPEQWADRFGLSQNDVGQISLWLKAQGFSQIRVARGRNWISFAGTAAQVQNAFGTEIHQYNVEGELHVANATAPKIPAALAGVVTGIRGLHDFHLRPKAIRRNVAARPFYNDATFGELVAPGDLATIYDINALYNATTPIDGTGQTLAVIGQTDVYLSDLSNFRTGFGLSSITCTTNTGGLITACNDPHLKYVLVPPLTDPLVPLSGDLSEADLDLEWSGAIAKNAQILYVNAPATFNAGGGLVSGGVWDAWYYAVDSNLAPVISLSYGTCEFDDNNVLTAAGAPAADEVELQKANSLGITFVNSTGDTGATECDFGGSNGTLTSTNLATQGLAVSYPASSPEVTGVGGSAIPLANLTPTYWGTTNGTDGGTALSYIPEQAWNDDLEIFQLCQGNSSTFCANGNGTGVAITSEATAQNAIGPSSTGGGPSNCAVQKADFSACVSGFTKPPWQTVAVSGQASVRFSPDVSFLATPNFPGYIFCTQLSELGDPGTGSSCDLGGAAGIATALGQLPNPSIIGGTSASAPVFAGMVALLNQSTGSTGQGNINPSLYQLAAVAPTAFHDITSGDNKVFCQAGTPTGQPTALVCPSAGVLGFSAATGYDLATGLGSLDLNNLAVGLANPPDFSASSPTSSLTIFSGQSGTATITVVPKNNFSGTVSFTCSGLPSGSTCSFSPTTVTPPGTTQTTATIQTGGSGSTSTVAITASTGVLSQISHPAASIALTVAPAFTLTPTDPSFQVAQGAAADATITVAMASGFTGTVHFTCTDPAPESTCTPPPDTNASGNVSFHITTTPPTTAALRTSDRGSRVFYAALFPGLLGILFAAGSRPRARRGMRLLGLVVVLGFSTLWLGSCGGSSSSQKDPGTPKGTYTVTVIGTSGTGSGAATNSTTFHLVVQ